MRRIDADLERLKPVALDEPLEGERIGVGRDEAVDFREGGRLALTEISPQNPAALHHRIGPLADIPTQGGIGRLGWRFEAVSRDIEQPAMERATQAAVLQPPEGEVRAAMRAIPVQEAEPPLFVAEQYKILPQQPDCSDRPRIGELYRQSGGLPVVTHQFSARRLRPDPCDQVVLFLIHHGALSMFVWRTFVRILHDCF